MLDKTKVRSRAASKQRVTKRYKGSRAVHHLDLAALSAMQMDATSCRADAAMKSGRRRCARIRTRRSKTQVRVHKRTRRPERTSS
jgi:hypothetical protein